MDNKRSALQGFGFAVLMVALLGFSSPTTFFENETGRFFGVLALICGLISIPEGMLNGLSFDRSVRDIALMGILCIAVIGGFFWFVTHGSLQVFPAHLGGVTREGSGFLPHLLR